jgi:hypothetical protein
MSNNIVRVAAKDIYDLLIDEERLQAERGDHKGWKSRVTGIEIDQPIAPRQGVSFSNAKSRAASEETPKVSVAAETLRAHSRFQRVTDPILEQDHQPQRYLEIPRIETEEQHLYAPSPMYESILTSSNHVTREPTPSPFSDISHGEDDMSKAIAQFQGTHRNVKDHAHVSTRKIPQIHASMHAQPQEPESQTRNTWRQDVGVWRESSAEDADTTTQDNHSVNSHNSQPREQVILKGSLPLHSVMPPPTPALPTGTTKQVSFISADDQQEYEDLFLVAMGSLTVRMPWLKVAETLRSEFTVSINVIHQIRFVHLSHPRDSLHTPAERKFFVFHKIPESEPSQYFQSINLLQTMGRSRSLTDRPGNFVKHLSVVTSILSNLLWQCITRYDPGLGNLYLHIFPHDS